MPLIKIDHIVSFSSEDPIHVASNILSSDTSKKWKCKTAGEKNAVVVLQLEKASVITAIDIGNEHSAYVEVLVSRSGTSDDYKVLLVMSSFMTPIESRQSQNVNKVRMFTKDQLSKPECDEKWDRVKIYCTQPFNKHVQYGLSFVKIHTSEGKPTVAPVQTHIGNFAIRPASPDNLTTGSLFSKKKEEKHDEELTGAAAIRAAASSSSLAQYGSPVCKPKLKTQDSPAASSLKHDKVSTDQLPKPRNRNEILYSKDEEEPNEKIDKIIEKKTKETEEIKNKIKDSEKTPKKKNDEKNADGKNKEKNLKPADSSVSSPSTSKRSESSKEKSKELKRKNKDNSEDNKRNKKIKNNRISKPFEKLLEGVVLVISGIQNPDRGNLRTLALAMGAKYKSDWDNTCTHLICAFPNTPKFNQVKGKGKIVKRTWLEDCHSQRKRLPWRRYALDKNDKDKNESEDEIWETVAQDESPVEENISSNGSENNDFNDSNEEASDTEERLARIEMQQKKREASEEKTVVPDIYSADTDVEEDYGEITPSSFTELMDIFDGRRFYIDQHFKDEDYNKLKKYIIAYKGISVENPVDEIDIMVTTKTNSTSLKEINSESQCVTPSWIWECHNFKKLISIDDFLL